jgi:hypothetical protein
MRPYFHHSPSSRTTTPRRTSPRSLSSSTRTVSTGRTRSEHAEIARASAAWEYEVARGLQAFIGQTIPLDKHEGLTLTHVLNLAEDETFAGWYNWRGITNPDMVLLGIIAGGPDTGATGAIAVDAKLSARSSKTQVLTETLALLLEPYQPLANLVDSLLGAGASDRLVLRNGFHVVRGVATTIGTAAKSTRALLDPEFAAEFAATRPVSLRPRTTSSRAARAPERPVATEATPRARPAAASSAPIADHAALFTATTWSLDRLLAAETEMPEPKGVYHLDDVLALDDRPDAPAEILLLGTHSGEKIAQAVALGPKRALPDDDSVRAYLATLPASIANGRYRIAPAFRVVAGKTDTLPVLGNRRAVVLPA